MIVLGRKARNFAESALSSPSPEAWKILLSVSVLYRDMAPWIWVEEEDLFGVRDPWTGEVGWCVVVGSLGLMRGLVVYRGDRGYKSYTRTATGLEMDFQDAVEADILTASFADRNELSPRDIRIIKDIGLSCRARKQWPQFRSQRPWHAPWYITDAEAKFLAFALFQTLEVAKRIGRGKPVRTSDGKVLVRQLQGGAEVLEPLFEWASAASGEVRTRRGLSEQERILDRMMEDYGRFWMDTWVCPPRYDEPVPEIVWDAGKVQTITSRASARSSRRGSWDVDVFALEVVLGDDTVPYCPAILLVGDASSGRILHSEIAKPGDRWNVLGESFLNFLFEYGQLPAEIRVERESVLKALAPLCQMLGVEVKRVRSLPLIRLAERNLARRFR